MKDEKCDITHSLKTLEIFRRIAKLGNLLAPTDRQNFPKDLDTGLKTVRILKCCDFRIMFKSVSGQREVCAV